MLDRPISLCFLNKQTKLQFRTISARGLEILKYWNGNSKQGIIYICRSVWPPVEPSGRLQEVANKFRSALFPVNTHLKEAMLSSSHQECPWGYIYLAWNLSLDNYQFWDKEENFPWIQVLLCQSFSASLSLPRRHFAKFFI